MMKTKAIKDYSNITRIHSTINKLIAKSLEATDYKTTKRLLAFQAETLAEMKSQTDDKEELETLDRQIMILNKTFYQVDLDEKNSD